MTSRRGEVVAFAVATLAVMALVAGWFDVLLTRPLWLDEIHTRIVASRATPAQVVSDLRAGIDTAPGLLHLALWGVGKAFGLSPFVLHLVPFLLVWLALVLVFATLRRRFDALPSVAGALAVGTHSLAIQMTYEARFYGPWLALCAGLALAIGMPRSRGRDAAVALLSAAICTIHWFGVISLSLMVAGALAARGRAWRGSARDVAPTLAGPVAFVLCLPILLAQREAITVPSWIPAPDAGQLWTMARVFHVSLVPLVAAGVLAINRRKTRETSWDPSLAGLAALAALPVALAVVSLAQPALLDRYATVATLAWAPLVAWAAQTLPRAARALAVALLLALGAAHYRTAIRGMERYATALGSAVAAFDQALRHTTLPIVFQSRHEHFQIVDAHPVGRERTLFLAIPDSAMNALFPADGRLRLIGPFLRFEREAALLHERVYGFPQVRTPAQLDSVPQFLLLASSASLPAGYRDVNRFVAAVFPRRTVQRLSAHLSLIR